MDGQQLLRFYALLFNLDHGEKIFVSRKLSFVVTYTLFILMFINFTRCFPLLQPDVKCERCHLQLITVMSDEGHGVPESTSCVYTGALSTGNVDDDSLPSCPVVYHSCSPVSIDGTVPRNDIDTCDTSTFEDKLNWPMKPNIQLIWGPSMHVQHIITRVILECTI